MKLERYDEAISSYRELISVFEKYEDTKDF